MEDLNISDDFKNELKAIKSSYPFLNVLVKAEQIGEFETVIFSNKLKTQFLIIDYCQSAFKKIDISLVSSVDIMSIYNFINDIDNI